MLEVDALSFSYRPNQPILHPITFQATPGDILGILGPNGAGKTTLFSLLSGLLPSQEGGIKLDGTSLSDDTISSRAQKGLIYLPQQASVLRKLSVNDNLLAMPNVSQKDVDTQLSLFGLAKHASQPAAVLSGGQRRRLEIARCMLLKPRVILLDEPFAGIDPIAVRNISELLLKLVEEKNITLIMTDHNIPDTLALCTKALLLYQGAILCQGSAQDVRDHPLAKQHYFGQPS